MRRQQHRVSCVYIRDNRKLSGDRTVKAPDPLNRDEVLEPPPDEESESDLPPDESKRTYAIKSRSQKRSTRPVYQETKDTEEQPATEAEEFVVDKVLTKWLAIQEMPPGSHQVTSRTNSSATTSTV